MWVIRVFSGDRRKPIVDKTPASLFPQGFGVHLGARHQQAPVVRVSDQPIVGQTLAASLGPFIRAGRGPTRPLGDVLVQDRESHVAQQRGENRPLRGTGVGVRRVCRPR